MTLYSTVQNDSGDFVFTYTRIAQTPQGDDVEIVDRVDIRTKEDLQVEIDGAANRIIDCQRVIDEKTIMISEATKAQAQGVNTVVVAATINPISGIKTIV